jgi:hypothetical protein
MDNLFGIAQGLAYGPTSPIEQPHKIKGISEPKLRIRE